MRRLKKGDPVIVITGNSKGTEGIIEALKADRVIVKGVNKKKRHVKGDKQGNPGKIVEFEAPINISNIAYCIDGKPCKLKARNNSDGKKEIYAVSSTKEEKVIRTI
jgi:large subunit ribosomal protein L24